jgi:agmatinase
MSSLTTPVAAHAPTFLSMPRCDDLATLDADIAIIGLPDTTPFDLASARQPSSAAPAAIRAASLRLVPFLSHYDFDFGGPILADRNLRIVDCGDVMAEPGEYAANSRRATEVLRAILDRGALPIVLGGDHAVPIPVWRAYEGRPDIFLVQIDAHIDWRDERNGEHEGLSSPMRRASEMSWVSGMAQIGIRGVGSARAEEFAAAHDYGSLIVGARELRSEGADTVLARVPDQPRYYLTFDADALDPGIAPGVGSPAFGGITYQEATDLLRSLAAKGRVVGADFVELQPARDVQDYTALLMARLILNLIGALAHSGQVGRP